MAQSPDQSAVDTRKKFVEAWNRTMLSIWRERIYKLKVRDTDKLYHSPLKLPVKADGRFYEITLEQTFLEYGLWQELGVGRNTEKGNTHRVDNDGFVNTRKRRPWMSPKYYSSTMNMRDFMAESLGDEFVGMFAVLDPELLRSGTSFYQDKGYS